MQKTQRIEDGMRRLPERLEQRRERGFGGARGSGTNDKAGSKLNLVRWVSARTIKENFNPPTNYRYPFMSEE